MTCTSCHCAAGSDTAALFHRTEGLAHEQQRKDDSGLSHRFCTHTTCGSLKPSCLTSVTKREGHQLKEKGNTTAPHNCFQVRGFLVESQALMPCLTQQLMGGAGTARCVCVCVCVCQKLACPHAKRNRCL